MVQPREKPLSNHRRHLSQFVLLDPVMEAQNNQTLFRCRERANVFPGLSGSSFRVKDNLPSEDALCVFGGTQCTFQ